MSVALLLAANTLVLGQASRPAPFPSDLKRDLEISAKDQIAHHGLPSVAIAVMQNGQSLYEAGFGLADREARLAATPSTPYPVASITKAFVGTTLVMLSSEKKLDLDLPVNHYLRHSQVHSPFWDTSAATVRLVANHTAGLTSYERVCAVGDSLCHVSTSSAINRYGILFWKPGDHFDYSNLGYGIVGDVVASAEGHSLAEVLSDRIFHPLGMSNCYLPVNGAIRPGSAASYDAGDGSRSPVTVSDTPGASSVFCSAHDLATFGSFILKPDTRKNVLTRAELGELVHSYGASGGVRYSFGWFEQAANGHDGLMAQGGTSEAFAVLQLVPDAGLVIAVVANTGFEYPSTIVKTISSRLLSSAQNAKSGAAEEAAAVGAGQLLTGSWTGSVHTGEGDVPIVLTVTSPRDLSVTVGGKIAPCKNPEVSATRIYCLGHGDLKTTEGPKAPYDFDLEVILHDDALEGAATTSGKTQLPYLVTLKGISP